MNKLDELNQELQRKNLVGFWTIGRGTDYEAYEPASPFEPCIWKWSDVAGALNKAGETLGLNESFRRVVVFNTPSLRYTTQTLFLGAQLVKPGEIAEAHRHTMGAIRFVVQGGGAQTTVNGEPFPMESGDLITTPSLTWHDHYNGSNQPIIWLDGADGPFVRYLGIGFGKRFDQRQQTHYRSVESSAYELAPARPNWISANPLQPAPYRYSWESTERTLEALGERPGDPYDGLLLRYVHPITGGPTLPTLSCEIQMLRPGETTKSHRHTSNSVYHVFKGNGFTVIDNAKYGWNTGDTFALPLWRWHHHGNSSSEETILFVINDRPIMEAFGFYREDTNGGNT